MAAANALVTFRNYTWATLIYVAVVVVAAWCCYRSIGRVMTERFLLLLYFVNGIIGFVERTCPMDNMYCSFSSFEFDGVCVGLINRKLRILLISFLQQKCAVLLFLWSRSIWVYICVLSTIVYRSLIRRLPLSIHSLTHFSLRSHTQNETDTHGLHWICCVCVRSIYTQLAYAHDGSSR